MKVRSQSYLFPFALLISLFFCTSAYSEKKNSVHRDEADRDVKIYNEDYKEMVAVSSGDIISYNSSKQIEDDNYTEYRDREDQVKPDTKKESKINRIGKKKISSQKSSEEFLYYIVKSGDTLFSIAKRSKMSLKKIQDINHLKEGSKICKGMKLKVSSGKEQKIILKEIKKKNIIYHDKGSVSSRPLFLWPLKKIKGYSRDGKDGVKSIGIVIKGNPGGEVIASENGVVKRVGYMRGYGKYIVLNHGKRYITVYSNLMEVDVKAGDTVEKGGRIGNISDDMTLHFQIDREGKPENPLSLLPGRS